MTVDELQAVLATMPGAALVVAAPVELSADLVWQERTADADPKPVVDVTADADTLEVVIGFNVGDGLADHDAATGPFGL